MEKRAIIIGAGPAGLTAAYELLTRTGIKPVILEKSGDIGGISKTVNYKGNRIDIGGHRFFSKSDRVMNWWMKMMPVEESQKEAYNISYQNKSRKVVVAGHTDNSGDTKDPDKVMLVRPRLSRIYFLRRFFTYPIQLSIDTLRKLGLFTTIAIMFSYLKAQLRPRHPEKTLEDFMINRFGRVLYELFFKDYTQKVWGVPCENISAEWGAQRIKGVSIAKAIKHAIQSATRRTPKGDISQKDTETSLIEQFLYPKLGPGQLWEEVARQIESMGGTILMHHDVEHIYTNNEGSGVTAIAARNRATGDSVYLEGDYFFSTMPVKELIAGIDGTVPPQVREIAAGLQYRDFITVGILLQQLSFQDENSGEWKPLELRDTWIYIQEKDVKVGRLQIFNNWSPYMVNIPGTVWVGMEFFCNSDDEFWQLPDEKIKELAIHELEKIGLASQANVMDATVLRMEKTYPAYFGAYERFEEIRAYTDSLENLFLVGRNGMHKYNNSDHSMLTAMVAVDNIAAGVTDKANIWAINTEQEYHEEKQEPVNGTEPDILQEMDLAPMSSTSSSLKDYVFRDNKILLIAAAILALVQLVGFKFLFPYANFMPDSYSYIEAAWNNMEINTWPIGYSKFLRVFSAIFKSDLPLVSFQYLFLQAAVMYFMFTVLYYVQPPRWIKYIIFAFLTLNPITLFTANYVSADALFAGLTLIWVVQLINISLKPNNRLIWLHGITILVLFMIRYNALYYPFISILVILLTKMPGLRKVAYLGLTFILLGIFIWHNEAQYQEMTQKKQFSAFGGWQLAANALFGYSHVTGDTDKVPARFAKLHAMVKHHIDSLQKVPHRADSTLGIYYLWNGPLIQYLNEQYKKDTITSGFKRWASMAPFYADYGKYLIKSHPKAYMEYYLWRNTMGYVVPQPEFLSMYNMKADSVAPLVVQWFGYKSQKVKGYTKEIKSASILSVFATLINILFVGGFIGFVALKGFKMADRKIRVVLSIVLAIWLLNFGFSVLASPIVLRYQLSPLVIFTVAALILVDKIYRQDNTHNVNS